MKMEKPSSPSTNPVTAAAQDEIGAMMQIGAAVASMKYESFSREILNFSVTGRMTVPIVSALK